MNYQSCNSLCAMFFEQAQKHADKPFLWAKTEEGWRPETWAQVRERVGLLCRGLRTLGVEPGDRVVIAAENRPEWLIAEMAILAAGAIAVPAYTTNTTDDHLHILRNSAAKGAIVSTRKLADRLLPAAHQAAACEFAVCIEPVELHQDLVGVKVHQWDDVLARGGELPDDVAETAKRAARTDTAVIIHTSGTGGAPKGVMLSHGAILHNCNGAFEVLRGHLDDNGEVFLSFLPLSHSYEHMAGQFFPMSIAAEIYYAESAEALTANMAEVRPTIVTAVPRLYEIMYQRVQHGTRRATGLKKNLFDKALELGIRKYHDPTSLGPVDRLLDGLVDRLVREKVRARFGGRLKYFVSGGAPLNVEIGVFFTALGVQLLQGYGLTESAPLISVNPPGRSKLHTVGPPVADTEVRIAEDGEILVRGELVMQGYYGDKKATGEAIKDGWLHTGDIGLIDDDGYLQITDRKKDLIVNSGGDNLSPQRIEGFLALQPEILQAMVAGDKRPYLVALIVPDPDFLAEWAGAHRKPAEADKLVKDSALRDAISGTVERVNAELAQIERVRRFMLVAEPFSVENGMMTPTLKIRRHVIRERYGKQLDALYG